MFCRTLPLSTLAQFGVFGTNQVFLAASPVDLLACAGRLVDAQQRGGVRDRELGQRGLAGRCRCSILIHSAPRPPLAAFAGTARSEPPRKDGVYWPAAVPGQREGRQLVLASVGLPVFGSVTAPTSQPLPRIAADVALRHDRVLVGLVLGRAAGGVRRGELLPRRSGPAGPRGSPASPLHLPPCCRRSCRRRRRRTTSRRTSTCPACRTPRSPACPAFAALTLSRSAVSSSSVVGRCRDAGRVPDVLAVDDDPAAGVVGHGLQLAVGRGAGQRSRPLSQRVGVLELLLGRGQVREGARRRCRTRSGCCPARPRPGSPVVPAKVESSLVV